MSLDVSRGSGAAPAGAREAAGAGGTDAVDPTVIFLHIGKTAGTTLRRIIRRHYPSREMLVVRARARPREETLGDFAKLSEDERRSPRVILGHTVYGIHELVPRPCTYITMLRNPVSLVLSQYSFVRRTQGHRHHRDALQMSFEEYVKSGVVQEMNNSQTRAIAGVCDIPYGSNPPELLEQAKRHIEEHFAVVGLTERFDESLVLLKQRFGWNRIHYVRANVARRKDQLSEEALALVREMNQLDLELYRWAEERFAAQAAATPGFDAELARLHRRNSLYAPWGAVTYTLPKRVQARFAPRGHAARSAG